MTHVPALVVVAILLSAVGFQRAAAMGAGDLFTSSANVHRLFEVEKQVSTVLQDAILRHEQHLEKLRSMQQMFAASEVPATDDELLPSSGFGVIRRLVTGMEALEATFGDDALHPIRALMNLSPLPVKEDLSGAAKGILRLQRTYDLAPLALMPEDDGEDMLIVGREAYEQKDYYLAKRWLELSVDFLNCTAPMTEHVVSCIEALDHQAYAHYVLGNLEGALKASNMILALQPENGRILDNLEYYNMQLAVMHNATGEAHVATVTPVAVEEKPRFDADNALRRDKRDLHRFRHLCQGKKMYRPSKPLKCYLTTLNKPHLILKPVRIERVHEGPSSLTVFRDFATGAELAHIRKEGQGKLERAVAYNDGKFKPVEFRISTAGWLNPNHDDVIMRINNRIADVTQLSLEYAEPLQVSNYGIGGFYETHFDHSKHTARTPQDGDRIATFMIYLNEVKAGGYTAFPRLGAAVAPSKGDAAFWYNLLPDGESDDDTLHGGCPVLQGSKWVANKWIHERGNEACRKQQ